jgi:outer membrane receptor protein involved in Fe transport
LGGVLRSAAAGAAAAALCAEPAHAAHLDLQIAPKAYSEALIDLALQAHVSLLDAQACPGQGDGLSGGFDSLAAALSRLLAGSGCGFRLVDARTVEILPPAQSGPGRRALGPLVSELLVTATKRSAREDQLATALSVISGEQLAVTRAHGAVEASGQIAGVITTNLGPGRDKLLVRGLSDGVFTGRARSPVSSYLDDAPINYDGPDPDLRLTDVERVEVMRGPQGALYGGGAIAGVYRIVTRKPDLAKASASISTSYAQTEGGSPSQDVDGVVNLPIAQGRAALRIVAYQDVQGGYIDDLELHRANVDRTLRHGVRAALRVIPAPDWTFDLSGVSQHLRSSDAQYTMGGASLGRASRVAEAHENRFGEVQATLQGRIGAAELSNSLAYVRRDFSALYDASAALSLFGEPLAQIGVYEERRRVRMLAEDLVVHSRGEGPLAWLTGLSVIDAREELPAHLQAMFPGRPFSRLYNEARKDHISSAALYGELTYAFAPRWSATLGGRVGRFDLRTTSDVEVAQPGGPRALQGHRTYQGALPKLSVQHTLASGGLVYGLFSTGARPGGFNSAGLAPPGDGRVAFGSDRLRNYELGVKLSADHDQVALRGAAFFDQWRNIQTDRYLPSGLAYTANVGDAEILGLEAEAAWRLSFGLSLQANVLATTARFTRRNPDFAQRLSRGLPGMPPFSGGVLAIYRRPIGHGLDLRLTGRARYIGRSELTFDAAETRPMGGYVDADLSAALIRGRLAAQLFVSNPANTARDTFAYGNPFSFAQVRQATPQRPRTIGLALSAAY